jgi:DegV family protein with EDD domain
VAQDAKTPLLVTDSCCDLPRELLADLGVVVVEYPVVLDGQEATDASGGPLSHLEFYERVRGGAAPSTAAVPIPSYVEAFRGGVEQGRPVILLGLSAALSGTFERALMARDIVLEQHPAADIRVIESLNASIALGVLVFEAAGRIADGADADALIEWVTPARTRVNAYFTLETLEHLRRGGRISDVAAVAGTVLDIKPVLRIDQHGALVISEKIRGRRKSMKTLVDVTERRFTDGSPLLVVAHGDSPEDAAILGEMLSERLGSAPTLVCEVGPVIGSHVGPGMLAVSFLGTERMVQ